MTGRSDSGRPVPTSAEVQSLLDSILREYGYDFKDYSDSHLHRRITNSMSRFGIDSVPELQSRLLLDAGLFHRFLLELSVNVTEMFRDPGFFAAIREIVVPLLKTYPFLKIWHAGCSTGEEVYSMAILLKEEELLDRCIIYATDFNQIVLKKAADAIYPVDKIREYTANYNKSGGKASFSDYFIVDYGAAKLNQELRKNIVFSDHNLVTDGIFGEMHMIICRNVLIYFNQKLQAKVLRLFYSSLVDGGLLGIGTKESLLFSDVRSEFTHLQSNIFRKKYQHQKKMGEQNVHP
jgi:chemotaxis protein methyltransferase CheR